jgi:hypothetical protein
MKSLYIWSSMSPDFFSFFLSIFPVESLFLSLKHLKSFMIQDK